MTFALDNKNTFTKLGTPYMWSSGDETTPPTLIREVSERRPGAQLGSPVAAGSGRIVIGYKTDDDFFGSNSGSAYIYDLNGILITQITAPDGATGDQFGFSVAVGSGRILVGAPYKDSSGFTNSGAVYIYDLNGNYIDKLVAYDLSQGIEFGSVLAVGSGRIVVGCPGDNTGGLDAGSVYVYDMNLNLVIKLSADTRTVADRYGDSVSVGSGRIVVGCTGDDDVGNDSGSAYVYDLNGNLIKKITEFDLVANIYYGSTVTVGSGRIIISDAVGRSYLYDLDGNLIKLLINTGNGVNEIASGSGRIVVGNSSLNTAHIFDLNGVLLQSISGFTGGAFGKGIAITLGRIIIGDVLRDIGGMDTGSISIYNTPTVYTIHDAIELEKGYL
jgi:WD40 repeat protein